MSKLSRQSVAADVRRRVLRSNERLWRSEDLAGSSAAVSHELRRLVEQGELVRLRRGLYWRGRKSRFGMSATPTRKALLEIVGKGEALGAAGWYATNLLGLSTQVSPVETLAITRRPPEGLTGFKMIDRTSRSGRRQAKLNDTEVTVLEALEGWDRYVEADSDTALRRFVEVLGGDKVRVERLVKASPTEPPVVRERLRAVLERGGWGDQAECVRRARDTRTRKRALQVIGG
jgi:Family of unknown function (DUF6088)